MTIRGWCPTLFAPMQSGDGLLLRIKPRLGVLTAQAALAVADAARELGNGMLGLTNRGNLQLRGFTEASAVKLEAIAIEHGLAHPEPAAEARRNVLVSPLIGLDPDLDPAAFDVAREMDDLLARRQEFAGLPGKFGLVVCGGGALPVAAVAGDILLQPLGQRVLISLDGAEHAADIPRDGVRDAVRRIILAFLATGPQRRMRDADGAAIFVEAGLVADHPRSSTTPRSPIGALPGSTGIGLPFGMLHADDLAALAHLATTHGDGTLRLTPWRAMLLPGRALHHAAAFITDPADPILRIEACPGAPFCASASVTTLDAARVMARDAEWAGTLHISGCAKGCAHPRAAALTLVGEAGQWNIIRDGRADATPLLRGQTIGSIAAEMPRKPK